MLGRNVKIYIARTDVFVAFTLVQQALLTIK